MTITFDTHAAELDAARRDYDKLVRDLMAVEEAHQDLARARGVMCLYLTDPNVDHENSEHEVEGSLEYWNAMYRSAAMAAGDRAWEYGLKINEELGYPVC